MNNDEFPFGYEFVKKAVLREINFGEADISKAEEMTVNGEKKHARGSVYANIVAASWMIRGRLIMHRIVR